MYCLKLVMQLIIVMGLSFSGLFLYTYPGLNWENSSKFFGMLIFPFVMNLVKLV